MLTKAIKATGSEITVFSSSEYGSNVDDFEAGVNSWLSSQPANVIIEDIIYQHCGQNSRGKDIFSMVFITRST
jgi:hypothetical protein